MTSALPGVPNAAREQERRDLRRRGLLGGAAARTFAREGARVFLAGRTLATLDKVAEDISAAGGRVETARVDVLDERAVEEHAGAILLLTDTATWNKAALRAPIPMGGFGAACVAIEGLSRTLAG